MTIGWPSAAVSPGDTSLDSVSAGPAGGTATIMRMGLSGHAPNAPAETNTHAATANEANCMR